MPYAQPYTPELNPGANAGELQGSDSIGQPIANALEYGGELMDQTIHQVKSQQRDIEASQAGAQLAAASTRIDQAAIDARANAGPGGAGHTQGVSQVVDNEAQDALAQIKDPHIRAAFNERWAQLKDNVVTREYGWEAGQRTQYVVNNLTDATDTYARSQQSNPTLSALPQQIGAIHDQIYSMSGIDDTTKHDLFKEQSRKVALAFANSTIQNGNPDLIVGNAANGTKGVLDAPEFSQYLKPDTDIDDIRREGQMEQRRLDAQQKENDLRAKAADVQFINDGINQVDKGVILTSDQMADLKARATKWGLGKDLFDLSDIQDKNSINTEFKGATPLTLHNAVNTFAAKVAAEKDGPQKQLDEVHVKNLTAYADQAVAAFNSDRFHAEAVAGNPAPQVSDWNNPDQVRARVAWARAVQQSSGLPDTVYLSNDEKAALQEQMKQGPTGKLEVAQTIGQSFGRAGVAGDVAQELAPGDSGFKLMTGFNPRVAQLYSQGERAISGKTVSIGSSTDQNQAALDRQAFNDTFAQMSEAIPTDMIPDFRDATEKIAAGIAAEYHVHDLTGDQLKQGIYTAMQRAAGRTGVASSMDAPGGLMEWQGHWAWLPTNVTSRQAVNALSRAGKDQWIAAGGVPYYQQPNGQRVPLTDAQISQLNTRYKLDRYQDPATRRTIPGIYSLVDPNSGGAVMTKDGKIWHFDIRKLAGGR